MDVESFLNYLRTDLGASSQIDIKDEPLESLDEPEYLAFKNEFGQSASRLHDKMSKVGVEISSSPQAVKMEIKFQDENRQVKYENNFVDVKTVDNISNNSSYMVSDGLFGRITEPKFSKATLEQLSTESGKIACSEIKNDLTNERNINEISTPSSSDSSIYINLKHPDVEFEDKRIVKSEEDRTEDIFSQQGIISTVSFECSLCKYQTNMRYKLNRHLLTHSNIKLFHCPHCNYETNRKDSLRLHSLAHSNTKLFQCSECEYASNQSSNLKAHLLTHSTAIKLFKCSHCDYECNHKSSLKRHSLIHSQMKLFSCTECGYECNHKSSLNLHLRTHSNTKLYKCAECDYKCNHKGSLKFHLLAHSNTKLFKCCECSYESNRKSHLIRHYLVHNNTKVFKCFQCGFESNHKSSLDRHLLTHSSTVKEDAS